MEITELLDPVFGQRSFEEITGILTSQAKLTVMLDILCSLIEEPFNRMYMMPLGDQFVVDHSKLVCSIVTEAIGLTWI